MPAAVDASLPMGLEDDRVPLGPPLSLTLTAVKVLTGHLEGCAGLAGLLQV